MARARDVIEHIERVVHHVRRMEQSAETAVQIHFSVQGHRTNDIMRTLTALTAVFLPLNLIAGIFGMNFEFMPLVHKADGFWMAHGRDGARSRCCWSCCSGASATWRPRRALKPAASARRYSDAWRWGARRIVYCAGISLLVKASTRRFALGAWAFATASARTAVRSRCATKVGADRATPSA